MWPGMMPILHCPGVMTPGQLGPSSLTPGWSWRYRFTRTMSRTGIPSVMAITSGTPASAASRIESAANGGGTKTADALAPVSRTASSTVLKMGTCPWNRVPPRPGVTPATTLVP